MQDDCFFCKAEGIGCYNRADDTGTLRDSCFECAKGAATTPAKQRKVRVLLVDDGRSLTAAIAARLEEMPLAEALGITAHTPVPMPLAPKDYPVAVSKKYLGAVPLPFAKTEVKS